MFWWRLEFGDHHGGFVGDPTRWLYAVVRDPSRRRGKGTSHSEHLVLARTKGSNTLMLVLRRGLVESADSSIPREKLDDESSCPYFTFRIYFENFTLCICFASICNNDLGLFSISLILLIASRLGEVGLMFRV
jgi:hypothetical protein